ncbi:MAG: TfoX/Sxy family protein [Aquabacterium sp.]
MATWRKSPAELVGAFDAALAHQPHAERRQMFGYPCAFVNGNMAIGLHEDRVIARVPGECDSRPCIMLGRRMKDYAAVDYDTVMADGAMAQWVARAVVHTGSLPPKAAKAPKAAKKAGAPVKRKPAPKPAQA